MPDEVAHGVPVFQAGEPAEIRAILPGAEFSLRLIEPPVQPGDRFPKLLLRGAFLLLGRHLARIDPLQHRSPLRPALEVDGAFAQLLQIEIALFLIAVMAVETVRFQKGVKFASGSDVAGRSSILSATRPGEDQASQKKNGGGCSFHHEQNPESDAPLACAAMRAAGMTAGKSLSRPPHRGRSERAGTPVPSSWSWSGFPAKWRSAGEISPSPPPAALSPHRGKWRRASQTRRDPHG